MERSLIEIRPLSITEIIAAALRSLYRNPGATLLISINFAVALGLVSLFGFYLTPLDDNFLNDLSLLNSTGALDPIAMRYFIDQVMPYFIFLASLTFLLYLFQGVTTGFIAPVIGFLITGNKLSRNEAWLKTKSQFGKLLILSLIILLLEISALLAPLFLAVLIAGIFPPTIGGWVISLSLLLSAVLLVVVWTSFLLAPVVLVLESGTVNFSLIRSRLLVKKNFARVFFGTIWAFIIGQALALMGQLPFSLLSQINQGSNQFSTFSIFSETVGAVIGYTLLLSFIASYLSLLYTDQRIRHEGLAEQLKSALGPTL